MNSFVGEKYTVELVALFEQQGPGLYNGQHSLCLTLPCLHYLQRKFSTLQEGSADPVSAQFPALQHLQDNLIRILSLKLISDKAIPLPSTATLNVEPFRALQTLVLKKVPLQLVTGLQRLRGQLKTLVVRRCYVGAGTNTRLLDNIDDVIVRCCGDESTSFAWNSLKELDLSSNSISKLGDSLQYLPCLEKVNFGNNRIGPAPSSASSLTGSLNAVDQSLLASVVVPSLTASPVNSTTASRSVTASRSDINYTEGIECIDSVTSLHLGFNNLQRIPVFGLRAKYNLKILNMRNNQLDNIDGIRELDRLVELDLTDNMLSKHMALDPLQNLHHLSILILVGNPLAYHPKHRIKTTKHLSNLINRNNFRLDGKKLSAAEKKVISSTLTHYPSIPPAFSPVSSQNYSLAPPMAIASQNHPFEDDQPLATSMPNPNHHRSNHGMAFTSMPNTPNDRDTIMEPRNWKKLAAIDKEDAPVAIPDDDDVRKNKPKSRKKEEHSGNPKSQELENFKHIRNEMQESWLKTNPNPVDMSTGSTTDADVTSSGGHSTVSRSSSQPPQPEDTSQGKTSLSRQSSMKKGRRKRHSHSSKEDPSRRPSRKSKKTVLEEKFLSESAEERGEYGPRASSPVQSAPPGDDGGDCFLVERYESDVEEESTAPNTTRSPKKEAKGEKELMLVISERFLEEKSSIMGDKFVDRWDLNTLQHASIEKKPWKSSSRSSKDAENQQFDVLSLQFNIERRDRSRRMYVLLEDEEVSQSLLSSLNPIIQKNQESLSLINRVECLACQHVFDVSQAFEQPSDEPQPLANSFAGRRRSLSKLLCPFCSSPILQYSQYSLRSQRIQTPSSYSQGHVIPQSGVESESPRKVVASDDNARSGFSVGGPLDSGSSRIGASPLAEEKQQSQEYREGSAIGKRDSPLLNGFDKEPKLEETSSGKENLSENRSLPELSTDDLSPWKKSKPTSLPGVAPASKPSLNPFDDLVDECEQQAPPPPHGVCGNGAQASSTKERIHDVVGVGRKSHDFVEDRPTNGVPLDGATGRNPFEDSGGKNSLDDFEYGQEEPSTRAEIPDRRKRSGAISDAFTRRSADLGLLSPMLESPGAEASMSVPAQYHFHDYMSGGRDGGRGSTSRDLESLLHEQREKHPSQTHNVTPPTMRKQYNASPLSSRKLYKDPASGPNSKRNSYGSTHSIDSLRHDSGQGSKSSSLDRGVRLRASDSDRGVNRYSSPVMGIDSSKYSPTLRRTPTDGHKRASSGSGAEMRTGRGSRRNSGSLRSSSDGTGIKGSSPLALYKDEDPSYIHNNLNLYLDMDVFNMDKGEHFKMVFKAPVMQYGHKMEIPALVVASSYKFYIFKITAPESTNAQQWLELIAVHHLKKLVYIDHGVGHQYLRVEFSSESACYTFLIRNDKKCTLCATMLAHIVTDVSKSSFRTVGVVPFTVDSIRNPDRVLREVIMTRYDKIKTIRSGSTPTSSPGPSLRLHRHINPDSRPGSTTSVSDDDELMMYRLVRRIVPGDKSRKSKSEVKMTLVLTEQCIYLGKENFAQWPLPKVQELPKKSELKPPFSNVHRKYINDIQQIVLDRDQGEYVCIRFFSENEMSVRGEDDLKWTLMMHSAACVTKLVEAVKTQWEAQFQTALPILRK